jgi:exportin-T
MLESMQSLAENLSDPSSQKAAFTFFSRCVSVWGQLAPAQTAPNGDGMNQSHGLPGFERFVYERLVPVAFRVLSAPQFNLKDPQMLVVSVKHLKRHDFIDTLSAVSGCT